MSNDFHLHNSFAFWLSRINHLLQEDFNQRLSNYEITWSQWLVLNTLHHKMAKTPAQIAEQVDVDRSAVTRLLDRLETKGYVVREHDKLDRRSIRIQLSSAGKSVVEEMNAQAYEHQQSFMKQLHLSERRALKGELQKILRTMGVNVSAQWQRIE